MTTKKTKRIGLLLLVGAVGLATIFGGIHRSGVGKTSETASQKTTLTEAEQKKFNACMTEAINGVRTGKAMVSFRGLPRSCYKKALAS